MRYAILAFLICLAGLYAVVKIVQRNQTPESLATYEAAQQEAPAPRKPVHVNSAVVAAVEADIAAQKRAGTPVAINHAEFQQVIAEVYGVEQSRFIQPDILWITLPAGTPAHELQSTCQAIANVWASRSRMDYVCVESWRGNTRLARATVHHQQMVTP